MESILTLSRAIQKIFHCAPKEVQMLRDLKAAFADTFCCACELSGSTGLPSLTVVYWIMTLFSSSGLKSVFFCSVVRICFICPTMQFNVLFVAEIYILKTIKDSTIVYNCNQTDLSIPVSNFTSICSITSFFLCRHSVNFGDELEIFKGKMRWGGSSNRNKCILWNINNCII